MVREVCVVVAQYMYMLIRTLADFVCLISCSFHAGLWFVCSSCKLVFASALSRGCALTFSKANQRKLTFGLKRDLIHIIISRNG